ncbi:MAG: HNH endonuclease [Ornithinibacter sp.]
MGSGTVALAERRFVVRAAREALADLAAVVHEAPDAELGELMGELDAVVAQGGAARAVVAAEAVKRGVMAGAGTNAHAWVRAHAPSLRQGGAGPVAKLAMEVANSGRAGGSLAPDAAAEPDRGSPLGMVWAEVKDGTVSPSLALSALGEIARLAPRLVPEAVPTVTQALLDLGTMWGPNQMRKLRPAMLARYGVVGEFDGLQAKLVSVARLSQPLVECGDVTEYQLVMTPEQAAVLEAAIGPMATPAPNPETGERDLRPAGQRRVEALTEVCRSVSGRALDDAGADGPGLAGAVLHVSVALSDLEARTGVALSDRAEGSGAGVVLGSTATGTLLSPEVLRRVACDAALVPYVLGTAGEELDQGRLVRLFTRAQRRRLLRRDRTCTFPGCTRPGSWTRAHHVLHWVDGGLSEIENAALVCEQHHTFIHTHRLWAEVRTRPDEHGRYVIWNLTPGSYDRQLEWLARQRAEHDPPPLTRQRLLELVAAVTTDAEADRRLAIHDLTSAAEAADHAARRAEQAHPDGIDAAWHAAMDAVVAASPADYAA